MGLLFEVSAVKQPQGEAELPIQTPMKAGKDILRNPSTDQKKIRRQISRNAADRASLIQALSALSVDQDDFRRISASEDPVAANQQVLANLIDALDIANSVGERGIAARIAERIDQHQEWALFLTGSIPSAAIQIGAAMKRMHHFASSDQDNEWDASEDGSDESRQKNKHDEGDEDSGEDDGDADDKPWEKDSSRRSASRLVPIDQVQAGDVLLVGPDGTPDPDNNTVEAVDGVPGMWIIDFTNGQSTPPLGNGSVYVASRRTAAVQVHTFDSTGEAYDTSQWRDDIHDGDVLVVPSEKVVGFLNAAWPCAVTATPGNFHQLTDPDGGPAPESWDRSDATAARSAGWSKAREIANQRGWALHQGKTASRRTAAEYYDDLGPGFTQNSFPQSEKREVATWKTKSGKYTLVVTHGQYGYDYDLYDRQWDTPRSSGGFDAADDAAAIAEIEARKAKGWLDGGLTRVSRRTAEIDPNNQGSYAGPTFSDYNDVDLGDSTQDVSVSPPADTADDISLYYGDFVHDASIAGPDDLRPLHARSAQAFLRRQS